MPIVKTTDYYGKYDTAGVLLKKGDAITVYWPDGTMTAETLREQVGRDSMQIDMTGGPDYFPTRRLFVYTKVHGKRVEIPLRGMRIEKRGK